MQRLLCRESKRFPCNRLDWKITFLTTRTLEENSNVKAFIMLFLQDIYFKLSRSISSYCMVTKVAMFCR